MATTVEERAAALLAALIAERGTTAAEVAAGLGLEPAAVERLLGGRESLELARLERVLGVLGAGPAAFFARLYGPEPAPAEASVAGAAASAGGTAAASAAGPASALQASAVPGVPASAVGAAPASIAGVADEPITRREVEEVLGTLRSMVDGMVRMLDAERAAERGGPPGEGGSAKRP